MNDAMPLLDTRWYTSASAWRKPEQLRGLLRNHADVVTNTAPLATSGSAFSSAQLALHPSETALAVALTPTMGATGSVGLMPLEGRDPSLQAAPRMRWMDLPPGAKTSSVRWTEDLLLIGSSRGRILAGDVVPSSCSVPGGTFEPCGVLHASADENPVSAYVTSPNSSSSTTLVRSIDAKASSVIAAMGGRVLLWDLSGTSLPVRELTPVVSGAPVVFTRWAAGSEAVMLNGCYDGSLVLSDTRSAANGRALGFATPPGYVTSAGECSPLIPLIVAAASSNGTWSLYDARYPSRALLSVPALQGEVTALRWSRLQSDLLITTGTDGSMATWNLRYAPTHCVGVAQFPHPLSDLCVTETFAEQRGISVSLSGDLVIAGLNLAALRELAPVSPLRRPEAASPGASVSAAARLALDELEHKERLGSGYLYTRQLKEAYPLLQECAQTHTTLLHNATEGLQWVNRVSPYPVTWSSYDDVLASDCGGASLSSFEEVQEQYRQRLWQTSSHLNCATEVARLRPQSMPDAEAELQLEGLRMNMVLQLAFDAEDSPTDLVDVRLKAALQHLANRPDLVDLIDESILRSLVAFLLSRSVAEGEKFVMFVLEKLGAHTNRDAAQRLTRCILNTAQQPKTTEAVDGHAISPEAQRAAKIVEERFYKNLEHAKEAVLTQLMVRRLGVEHHREVIAAVNAYQGRCLELKQPGMFGWLGLDALRVFLQCLAAESNYVTFFWSSVQCMESVGTCPGVVVLQSLVSSVVSRIVSTARGIAREFSLYADVGQRSVPQLRQLAKTLPASHAYLTTLIRVQLESENVALASKLKAMPPRMKDVLDELSEATEQILDVWADLMDSLTVCEATAAVRRYCLASVQHLVAEVEDLVEVSAKKDRDERLAAMLDVCDAFLDAFEESDGSELSRT